MAKCDDCRQGFADKKNEARCLCSCHSALPFPLPRRENVAQEVADRMALELGAQQELQLRGLMEFGG